MDLHDLISKLEAIETSSMNEGGCGDPMPSMPAKPEPPAPTMSVNINAQGMDNIEDMIGLMKKLGGVDKPEMPSMPSMPAVTDKPMIAPLKMLPDLDDTDDLPPMHDKDHKIVKTLDKDGDGDHDMDDHDEEKKDEAYANEPNEEYDDVDYILNTLAGGMNRPKGTHSTVAKGDNPMQKIAKHESEEKDLRTQIKEELAQRLAEYKGEN